MRTHAVFLLGLATFLVPAMPGLRAAETRPNVILIITDDQGYGDLGVHGNPQIRTPHLDRLAREGVRLTQFHVSPVCSPTRASLLTGRYNYRTGVVDTFQGRSLMRPDEVTLAERLRSAGYRTGIFGKWHLGDNAPLRPQDRGFQQSLVLKGGGIGQPSDLPGGSHYVDPVLLRNGAATPRKGYVSDVVTDGAIDFLKGSGQQPFFLYLSFNCPHDPLEAPEPELASYRGVDVSPRAFPTTGQPLPATPNEDAIRRVYAMVTNIDTNVGRLMGALDAAGRREDTIVVFLTDNGPSFARYNAGMRDVKGSVYEGGLHVPCFVRWPGRLAAGREVPQPSAHIDLTPTLLEACRVPAADGPPLDGRSLLPMLRGQATDWPERSLVFQWHRGNAPEEGRNFSIRRGRFKLLRPDFNDPSKRPPLELYDLEADPYEQRNLAAARPDLVASLEQEYRRWFRDVSARGYEAIPIAIGDARENPTLLTPQDWRRRDPGAGPTGSGAWHLTVARPGRYQISAEFPDGPADRTARLSIQGHALACPVDQDRRTAAFPPLDLRDGPAELESWVGTRTAEGRPRSITVTRLDDR